MDFNKTIRMSKCDVCSKEFIEAPASIYKIKVKDKVQHCCSYHCYRKRLKELGKD